MARRKPAAPKSRKPAKPSKPSRQKAAPKAPVEKVDKPGMPVESAVALLTGVLLLVAIVLVFVEKGMHYGEGPFSGMFGG
jgi:hypothetical protein